MEIKLSTNRKMYGMVKEPLAVCFDEEDRSFTVDMSHKHAARLVELVSRISEEAEKPIEDYEGDTHEARCAAAEAAYNAIRKEVESLSNQATEKEYMVAYLVLRKAAFELRMSERADAFLDNHPTETECPNYWKAFLNALNDAAGLEAVLTLGYLMGKGICNGSGEDIAVKAPDANGEETEAPV